MKRRHLCELVPPWSDGKVQLVLAFLGLGVGVLSSLYCYLSQLETAWGSLSYLGEQGELHWTAMTDFADLVGSQGAVSNWFSRPAFFAFPLLMLAGLALAGYNWACFRRGSRSIYLMRRLPDRWELARRCLTIPLVLILGAVVLTVVLLALYYAIYLWGTPAQCLRSGQLEKLWANFGYLFHPFAQHFLP